MNRLVFFVFVFVVSTGSASSVLAQAATTMQEALERIEEMTALELAKENVGAVTVGVVSGSDLVWTESFGFADMERNVMATKDTVYRVGSITKQFTGLMLVQLAERGKVRLSDPVEKYFPEVRQVKGRVVDAPPITLVQLATMTSGLAREPEDLATYLRGSVWEWEAVLISALPKVTYAFEPDTRYLYSNVGYAILGASLSRAADQPYTEYIHEHFFDPLGMTQSAFEPNEAIASKIAKGYTIDEDGVVSADAPTREHLGRGYKVPNGAMYTTVGDLAKFIAFELGEGPEGVIEQETLAENYGRANSTNGELDAAYGVGFRMERVGELILFGHTGSVAGYRAAAFFHRPTKTGVVALRNVGGRFNVAELARRAMVGIVSASN